MDKCQLDHKPFPSQELTAMQRALELLKTAGLKDIVESLLT